MNELIIKTDGDCDVDIAKLVLRRISNVKYEALTEATDNDHTDIVELLRANDNVGEYC